ncbi:uncharacterized protein LOC129001800 [Macrosteles quadrilineatus]|uniref:uncharacterized protein LOC129001800 n=1 Tax=Macrosteles quadrilineatus TaxID=74068 RepID=UPI0023E0CB47|nr:uncharacterized protein LOC129001800 [Macrosteles quadrilineatus]
MRNQLLLSACLLLLAIQHSTQQKSRKMSVSNKLIRDIERGVVKELKNLENSGVTLSKGEAEKKLFDILMIESVKNMDSFRRIHATEIPRVINKAMRSREVMDGILAIVEEPIAPRVIGSLIMGGSQVATDLMTMILTRY